MKKIITFLIFFIFPLTIYADSVTKFSLNEVTASPGSNVTIKLDMDNNQSFGVLSAKILYDNTKLEYVSSQLKGLDAMLRGTDKNETKGIIAMYAINLSDKKLMKDNGTVMLAEFKVKDDVTDDIPLTLKIVDFGVNENESLKYEAKDGLIKIKSNVSTVTKEKKESLLQDLIKNTDSDKLKDNTIIWSTTDPSVAAVDDGGNVTFSGDGNVTIEAKDSDGNLIYSKDYYVKEKIRNNYYLIGAIVIGLIIIITVIIILWRKKCKNVK